MVCHDHRLMMSGELTDARYFPKGAAHTVQGLDDENEYLLVFDEADFDKVGYVANPR